MKLSKKTQCAKEFTCQEIKNAILNTNPSKSPGPKGIHPRLLHLLSDFGIETVTRIFNKSWNTATVPQEWKKAILKNNKPAEELSSYRPISLMSVLGKVMERAIVNRLRYIIESKNLLINYQPGFRPRRSMTDQLLRLSQTIADGFQSKPIQRTVLTLLDDTAAYDTV